ncbi:MAG TPA: hypothetical protein DCS60_08005 [Opitutae bacterium]|nr:hypothetical protein [Opitutae bacterium]
MNGEGQAFYDQEADTALFEAIRTNAQVEVIDFEETINSFVFARACAEKLLKLIQRGKP